MSVALIADAEWSDFDIERELFAREGLEMVVAESRERSEIIEAAPAVQALLVVWTPVDRDLMSRLPDLKVIGRFGTGVDIIDVRAATDLGIAVVNAGQYATSEVAAHTVGMILSLVRRLMFADRAVRQGAWNSLEELRSIRRLSSLRAGIVGLGHIGRRVAALLTALDMTVVGYDPFVGDAELPLAPTLEELLCSTDVVSIHVPLTETTRHLLDEARIKLLPAGAFVVNTSRGGVIKQDALVSALETGALGGAALDVFEEEPLPPSHPLCSMTNVLLTPHIGYFSRESLREARQTTVSAVISVLRGRVPPEVINPNYASSVRSC